YLLASVIGISALALVLWTRWVRRFGPEPVWRVALSVLAVGLALMSLASGLATAIAIGALGGFGYSGVMATMDLIVARLLDEDMARTGHRREGMFLAAFGFFNRLDAWVKSLAFLAVAALFGYQSGDSPGPHPEIAAQFLLSVFPAVLVGMAAVLSFFVRFDRSMVERARAGAHGGASGEGPQTDSAAASAVDRGRRHGSGGPGGPRDASDSDGSGGSGGSGCPGGSAGPRDALDSDGSGGSGDPRDALDSDGSGGSAGPRDALDSEDAENPDGADDAAAARPWGRGAGRPPGPAPSGAAGRRGADALPPSGAVRHSGIPCTQSIPQCTIRRARYRLNGFTRRGRVRGGAVGGSRRRGGRMGIRGAGAWVYGGWRLVYTTTARHPCGYRAVDGRGPVSGGALRAPVAGPAPTERVPRRRGAAVRRR